MNKTIKLSTLGAAILLTFGCSQDSETSTNNTDQHAAVAEAAAPAQAIEPIAELTTVEQKAAYAIGVSFSQYLVTSLNQPQELGIDLDTKDVFQGIHDSFGKNVQLTEQEIEEALKALDALVSEKLTEYTEIKSGEVTTQGHEFREAFKLEKDVTTLSSGLMIQVHEEGKGEQPTAADTVTVHYHGKLVDGSTFDSSYDRGEPATFPLNQVIQGWTEGLQQVNVGSKLTLVIPPELAYGQQSTRTIPGGSTLIFDIELLNIEKE